LGVYTKSSIAAAAAAAAAADDDRDGPRNVGLIQTPDPADSPRRLHRI